jgi:two-component system, chemotaxis family, response regulator Rcp1
VSKNQKLLHGRRAVVLLVEDNDNDVELTRIGFEQADYAVDLEVALDGEHCLKFLRKENGHANASTPDLILLDLHMPRMGGLEVLDAINADEQLRHIPVIVLTTSNSEHEIKEAYRRHCCGYLVKPVGFAEFVKAVQAIEAYWFTLIALPSK